MPNLVAYLHVRLNLNIAEDAEIYRNLTKLPEGERSRTIRIALLAYFKGLIASGERRTKRTNMRKAVLEPQTRTEAVLTMKQEKAAASDKHGRTDLTTEIDSGALNNMLDLIQ